MKVKDLKARDLREIVKIYEKHCGNDRTFEDSMCDTPTGVLKELKKGGDDYRIGSKWNFDSKIYLLRGRENEFELDFYHNFYIKDRHGKEYEECVAAGRKFIQEANEYLRKEEKKRVKS